MKLPRKIRYTAILLASLVIAFPLQLRAQNYEIPASLMGSGGNIATSNNYETRSFTGEPVSCLTSTSQNYQVESGFKYIVYELTQVGVAEVKEKLPRIFSLSQNYPNPFNARTGIKYALPKETKVIISIYNIAGAKVRTLVNKNKKPGHYTVYWNACDDRDRKVVNGIYFYKIQAADFTATKKMILLK